MSMKEVRNTMIEEVYASVFENACGLEEADEYNRLGLFDRDSYNKLHDEFCKKHIRPEELRNRLEDEAAQDAFVMAYESHKSGFMAGFKVAMALVSGEINFEEGQGDE